MARNNEVPFYLRRQEGVNIPSIIDLNEAQRERVKQSAPSDVQRLIEQGEIIRRRRDAAEREEKRKLQRKKEYEERERERKRQEEEELDKQLRQQKEEERLEQERKEKEADEAYEKSYQQWITDKTDFLGPLQDTAKGIINNIPKLNNLSRAIYGSKNAVGNFVMNQLVGNALSQEGRIALNDNKIDGAKAHQKIIDLQQQISSLEQERDNLVKQEKLDDQNYVAANQNTIRYQSALQAYNKYNTEIQSLYGELQDPLLNEKDKYYKAAYVADNMNAGDFINTLGGAVMDKLRGITVNSFLSNRPVDPQTARLREDIARERFEKTAARYDAKVQSTKRDANGVILNNTPIGDKDYDYNQTQKNINRWEKENEIYADRRADDIKWQDTIRNTFGIAKAYEDAAEVYQNSDLWDFGFWFYGMPGTMGMSFSSPDQAVATGLQAAGVAATVATGNPLWMNTGTLGSGYFQLEAGKAENYGEVGEKRADNIYQQLQQMPNEKKKDALINDMAAVATSYWKGQGQNQDWITKRLDINSEQGVKNIINDALSAKAANGGNWNITDPELRKMQIASTAGLQAQFEADNTRTISELPFQLAFEVWGGPLDKMIKKSYGFVFDKLDRAFANRAAGRFVREGAENLTSGGTKNVAGETLEQAERAAHGKYKNGFRRKSQTTAEAFRKGWQKGSTAGEMGGFGYFGGIAGGTIGGVANATAHLVRETLPKNMKIGLDKFEQAVANKYMNIYDKVLADRQWIALAGKYGYQASKNILADAASEMAEEGVQYLNAKEDFAKKYGYGGVSFGDLIMNDMAQGIEIMKAYGSLLGLSDSELKDDAEFWPQLKSAFAMSVLGMGTVTNVTGAANDINQQLDGDKFVAANFAMSREADKINRASNVGYAKAAMEGKSDGVRSALKTRMQHDMMRETPEYTQEMYDEQINDFENVTKLANNQTIREKLEAKGIEYGTDRFAHAIADIANLRKQAIENANAQDRNNNDLNSVYYSKEFNDEVQQVSDDILSQLDSEQQNKIKEAGDKAVAEYLQTQRDLERDTNSAESKRQIREIREAAEEAERENINNTVNTNIRNITRAANKLHGLLKLKSKISTIDDWYKTLSEKFGIKTLRPDSKLIVKNIEQQIKQQKEFLKDLYENFNTELSDAETIKYINGLQEVVRTNSEQAEELEIANALIGANSAVVANYLNQFEEGLVVNKDGKYEYNPAQYKVQKDRQRRMRDAMMAGDLEQVEAVRKEDSYETYYQKKVANNPYAKRVDAIIETNKRNEALDWMVEDIASGDAVVKAYEAYEEDKNKQPVESKEKTPEDPFDSKIQPESKKQNKKKQDRLIKNKQKYQRRIAKARDSYNKRKAKYNNWKRGSLNAAFLPFQDALVKAANALWFLLEDGVYTIARFVEDMQMIVQDKDVSEMISDLKRLYIGKYAQLQYQGSPLVNNMSTPAEVAAYIPNADVDTRKAYQPPTTQITPVIKGFKNWLTSSRENVIPEISGYFDTIVKNGDSVDVYQNKAAVQILSKEAKERIDTITNHLKDLSGQSLHMNLSQYFPEYVVVVYMRYSSNKDVINAAARAIYNAELDKESKDRIQIGKTIRDNVVKIFNGDFNNLVKIGFSDEQWNDFVNRVQQTKQQAEARGFTVLDTMQPIYGTDKDGNKLSSEADIILVNEAGDIQIIDVTYGFASVYARLSNPRTNRVHLDQIYQNESDILDQITEIIQNTYPTNIKGTYVWPFLYNYRDHDFRSEDIFRMSEEQIDKSQLEQNVKKANKLVEHINSLIDDYNSLAKYLNREQKTHISPYAFDTQTEFDEYFEQLGNLSESLSEEVRDLDRDYQVIRSAEDEVIVELLQQNTPPDDFLLSFTIEELHKELEDSVASLDDSLINLPVGKITNQNERQNMIEIYGALFRAQNALNEYLNHPDAERYDVSSECEVIATVLERIHMSRSYLGTDAIFVQNWWLSKFTLDDGVTHNVHSYINAIRNWLNTLSGYVNEDDNFFDQHPRLAQWYSSILNTHFSKLVDRAEKLQPAISDNVTKSVLEIAIRRARQLISDFNINWGVEPDRAYDNPPATMLEYISRMPLRWKDLYGVSESHSPAIDQMANSQRPYYYFSQLPDFLSKSKITFGLNKNGDVQVRIQYGDGPNAPFANFTFDNSNDAYGENLTPEIENRNRILNRGNRKFTAKLKAMIEYRMKHPEYEIEVDAHVNKGSIHYSKNKDAANSVVDVIFSDPYNHIDLYNVTVSEQDHIGVLSTVYDFGGNVIDYKVKTGPNLKSDAADKFDSEFKKRNLNTSSGMLVYFFDYGDGKRIGIPMRGSVIGESTANKLVDLIQKASVGIQEEGGYNIQNLLQQRLFIKFGDQANRSSSFNNTKSLITVTGENAILIKGETYNLNTQRQEVVDIISKTPNVIPGFLLSDRIANVVPKVVDKFRDDSSLQQITLPNGFIINREDISKNSTWLGYFFRNNIVVTRAEVKQDPKYPEKASIRGYRQINFSNPRLVLKEKPKVIENKQQDVQTADQAKNNPNNIFGKALHRKNSSLHMIVTKDQMVQRTDEEQKQFVDEVREFFTRVFGTSEDVVFTKSIEDALKLAGEDEVIAGECTSQLIQICTSAPFSAAYHEAFHKIIELILSDSERNAIYDAYRSHNGEKLSERAVAEGLADMFVDYMSNKREYKNAKWYKKPVILFKKVGILASLVNMLGYRQAKAMFRIYGETNKGKINERGESTEEKRKRFQEVFDDHLYKTITSRGDVKYTADFKYLQNSTDVHEMCKSLGYLLATRLRFDDPLGIEERKTIDQTSLKLIDDQTRRALCNLDDNDQPLPIPEGLEHRINAWREVFESKKEIRYDKRNKPYYETVYPKFAALHTMVGDYLAAIAGDYKGKYQLAEEEEDEDEKVQRNNIDKYDKASIEFNKLSGVTDRVKLFFGTIPYITQDGDYDYSKSQFGTPTFMPLEEVYNVVVNNLYNVRSIEQLRYEIEKRAAYDPMYMMINEKFQDLYELAYYTDDNGNAQINYDAESMLIQILMAVRSQKHDFKIARTKKDKSGNKTTSIITSSSDRDTKIISRQWQQMLVSGQVGVFQHGMSDTESLTFRKDTDPKIFDNLVSFFNNTIIDLSQNADTYSADRAVQLRKDIVKRLNQIGILISDDALKHMLLNKYQGVGADSIYRWLTSTTKETSIHPFIANLRQFAPNGKVNTYFINDTGFSSTSFVTNLANAEGAYRRITTQQTAYGLDGKKLYTISQNSSISKICDDLNTGNPNEPLVKLLSNFNYNLYNDGLSRQGSLILKKIADGNPANLKLFTFIGAKTDNKGDRGSKYLDLAKADDYIAKLTMLQDGDIIMPALADKGTYQGMEIFSKDGQKMNLVPGIRFIESKDANGKVVRIAQNAPKIAFMGNRVYLRPCDAVLRQMIEYAVTEKVAIEKCMEDLKTLKDNEKIKNYHTKNKNGVEPNGTRFLQFTEIIVETSKGKFEPINLNDPNESSKKMLQQANDYFFSKPIEEQMTIMAQTLAMHTMYEVQEAENLGLITRTDVSVHNLVQNADGTVSRKEVLSNNSTDKSSIINVETDQLNEQQINLVMQQLIQTMPESWEKLNSPRTIDLYNERLRIVRSAAIAAILQDATLRSIISAQEVLRCFCGHPGMFKVEYDKVNKRIKDSTFDLQKRIGGMISTGDDNVTDLPQIKKQYVCAEIKDYEVASSSDVAPRLQQMFESGMLVDLYNRYSYNKDWNVNADDVKNLKTIPDRFSRSEEAKARWAKLVNKIIETAYVHSSSYQAGINVADGAAYITADMCRDMLRMNGRLDEKAKKALDILTNPDTQYSWEKSAKAYKEIYDAINITPTKYTAYGFREHITNGSQSTKVAIPYYNKFALFPIFPCMASGNMKGIYDKMIKEGVDMALMDSAVKVGSQGAVKYDGTSINEPFTTYIQEFSFIRKQLNTDPEEGSKSTVGSQVIKVCLQSLILDKPYKNFEDGKEILGQDIYDQFMKSIREISEDGVQEILDEFMEDQTEQERESGAPRRISVEKLSKYLNDQLSSRNASSTVMEAIQTHNTSTGLQFNAPLAATSDATWIESIIISHINKKVIDINAPGSSFIQRSVFAIEGGGNPYLTINDGKKLQMINESGSMDCILSIDYFTDVLFANKMGDKSFEEQRQWLIDHHIIGNTPDVIANTVGYRIPTQAQSSIHALRCVDILPAQKNTIILPEEFTRITGSDKYQCSNIKKFL